MTQGLSHKFAREVSLEGLSREDFLVIAAETVGKLGWKLDSVSENGVVAHTKLSMTSWGEEVTVKIGEERAVIRSMSPGQLYDWGRNRKNVERFIKTSRETRESLTPEAMEARLAELRPQFVAADADVLARPEPTRGERILGIFSVFVPRSDYFITPILVDLNILLFVAMVLNGANVLLPDYATLIRWGANFRPVTLEGEWWRLVTCCFLHIGVVHLLVNLYALIYIGLLLEPRLGKARFLAAYLLSGIAASTASLWWHPLTISAGASGAIFGMYGVFLAMLTTRLVEKSVRQTLLLSIAMFVVYNLMSGLKEGIDAAAHIGGLVSGLLIGYAYVPGLRNPERLRLQIATTGILTAVVLTASFVIYSNLPNDIARYDEDMKKFATMESMALELYRMPATTPQEQVLDEIKNRGIYYWNENLRLLDSFKDYDLPPQITARNAKLKEYCELRIKTYELICKAIEEDTDVYADELTRCNERIEKIIAEIN